MDCELNPASQVAKSSARASSAISSPVSGPPGPWQVLACGIQWVMGCEIEICTNMTMGTLGETSLGNLIAMENQHCFHSAKLSTFKMASILAHSALGQGATGLHDRELLHLRWQERDQTGPRRGCRSAWDVGATEIGKIGEAGKGSHWQKGPQNSTV